LLQQVSGEPVGGLQKLLLRVHELPVLSLLFDLVCSDAVGGRELSEGDLIAQVGIREIALESLIHA
jgi:hypothetical protein